MTNPDSKDRTMRSQWLLKAYVLMTGAWLFDFQSEGAGQGLAIQSVFAICYAMGFLWFIVIDKGIHIKKNGAEILFYGIVGNYLFLSILSAIHHEQDSYQISRLTFNILIYALTAYTTSRVISITPTGAVRAILGHLCFLYGISSALIILLFKGGVSIDTVRYEIQGTSSIAALAFGALIVSYKLKKIEVLAITAVIAVIFLTVTRSYILVAFTQIAIQYGVLRGRLRSKPIVQMGIIAITLGVLLVAFGGDTYDRWIERLLVSKNYNGIDPTLETRTSEIEFMLASFVENSWNLAFGSGLATQTTWFVPSEVGGGTGNSIGFGHNQHISILFTAGIIGGLPLLLLQFYQGYKCIRLKQSLKLMNEFDADQKLMLNFAILTIIGYLAINFLSSSFISRGFTLWYAIATGVYLSATIKLKNIRHRKYSKISIQ